MRCSLVIMATAALEVIRAEAPASADGLETGGILLGHDDGEVVALRLAGDPGPKAERGADRFLRDLEHAQRLEEDAHRREGSVWVGEWHTHPTGSPIPSPRDSKTYAQLLEDEDLHFDRIVSLIVTADSDRGWDRVILWPWVVTPGIVVHAAQLLVSDAPIPRAFEEDEA
jgi:integrative and conjugative element protein (TIGR02256 family)